MGTCTDKQLRDVEAYARGWCAKRRIPDDMLQEVVNEAWIAALESDNDKVAVRRAIDRFARREYRHHDRNVPLSYFGSDLDGDAFAIEDGGLREEDLGLHEDQYHGWCRDDVA